MKNSGIESLISYFDCDDVIQCQKARRELVALGHQAVPALTEALGSKRHWIRWEAAKALSQIGDSSATDSLVRALEDNEFDVRWLAAEGLITIGKKAVRPLLTALLENAKSTWLREGAHHILHDMNRGDWDKLLRPVMDALEDGEPAVAVPFAARKALDDLENKNA